MWDHFVDFGHCEVFSDAGVGAGLWLVLPLAGKAVEGVVRRNHLLSGHFDGGRFVKGRFESRRFRGESLYNVTGVPRNGRFRNEAKGST